MKKILSLLLLAVQVCTCAWGQPTSKPALGNEALDSWPLIDDPKISGDGKVVCYTVSYGKDSSCLVIQAVNSKWKKVFLNGNNPSFSADSRHVVFNYCSDSIGILDADNGRVQFSHASAYTIAERGDGRWLALLRTHPEQQVVLYDFKSGKEQIFNDGTSCTFSPDGKVLISQLFNRKDSSYSLMWTNTKMAKSVSIHRSNTPASNFSFDEAASQLAFMHQILGKVGEYRLWYFKPGSDSATVCVNEEQLEDDFFIASGNIQFSRSGQKIFFPLRKRKLPIIHLDPTAQVNLWRYDDLYLNAQQKVEARLGMGRTFRAVVNLATRKVIRLEQEQDFWPSFTLANGGDAEFVLLTTKGDWSQEDWNKEARGDIFLVSTISGERIKITDKRFFGINGDHYAPTGKYVIWFDRDQDAYFTYNVVTKKVRNISSSVPFPLSYPAWDFPQKRIGEGIIGWSTEDRSVFVYDEFDIWELDPESKRPAVNLTNGFGRKNGIVLRQAPTNSGTEVNLSIGTKHNWILTALNNKTKDNGFYTIRPEAAKDPSFLTSGQFLYYYNFHPMPANGITNTIFLKAENQEAYLVTRMGSGQYPNLYFTRDMKKFINLSNLQPEKSYNWYTSELIHWKTLDDKAAEGVLYKPENFDPNKKYPVIFHFYEKDANSLNNYIQPKWSDGRLNISYFVSNGYIVCDPNIYYEIGHTRESVYNSVVSAVRYLSQFSWVDTSKMGLQGHSFGAYEVNCLVTSTSLFAAAVSAAGAANLSSKYGSIRSDFGITGINTIETGQNRIGAKPWENPQMFIENSPLFYADKVTTPLLMMHNQTDGAVPFSQSLEFFNALRRLGKKVWLLDYDRSSHQVEGRYNKMDYTLRLKQFFDYYLKNAPIPLWMTNDRSEGPNEAQSNSK